MVDILQAIIDIADSFLLGIPSNVFMGDISNKYGIDIADLQRTYDMLSQQYNEDADFRDALQNKQYEILGSMSTTSPLGSWRTELQRRYDDIGKKVEATNSRLKQIGKEMAETSTALTKKQLEANAATLGSETSKKIGGFFK